MLRNMTLKGLSWESQDQTRFPKGHLFPSAPPPNTPPPSCGIAVHPSSTKMCRLLNQSESYSHVAERRGWTQGINKNRMDFYTGFWNFEREEL